MYSDNDYRNYLEHAWGKSAEQKAREREYNHEYWLTNRERIMRNRLSRSHSQQDRYADERLTALERQNESLNYNVNKTYALQDVAKSPSAPEVEGRIDNNRAIQQRNSLELQIRNNHREYSQIMNDVVSRNSNKALTAVRSAIDAGANAVANAAKKIGNFFMGAISGSNSMPTNASDLAAIERERNRR